MKTARDDAAALAEAVKAAVDGLGPFATARLLQEHVDAVRLLQKAGDFPRMLYGPNGQTLVVDSASQEAEAGEGWSREPQGEHRAGQGSGAVATTREALAAELAVRRRAVIENPADGTDAFNDPDTDSQITDSTTTRRPVGRPRKEQLT